MPTFKNDDRLTPMTVHYQGETYVIPPGGVLTIEEPAPVEEAKPEPEQVVEQHEEKPKPRKRKK